VEKREEILAEHPEVEFVVVEKRGKIKAMPEGELKDLKKAFEKAKAQVGGVGGASLPRDQESLLPPQSALSRHGKNQAPLYSLFALANLTLAKRSLLGATRA
jgi:hypothetical protein